MSRPQPEEMSWEEAQRLEGQRHQVRFALLAVAMGIFIALFYAAFEPFLATGLTITAGAVIIPLSMHEYRRLP